MEVLRFHLRDGGPADTPPTAAALSAGATSADDAASVCGAEWWVQVRDLAEATGANRGEAGAGAKAEGEQHCDEESTRAAARAARRASDG